MSGDFFTVFILQATLIFVFFDMMITVLGIIIQMFELLHEDYCYEEFFTENSLLVTCKNHLIDAFVFYPFFVYITTREDILFFIVPEAKRLVFDVVKFSKKLKEALPAFIK